MSIYEEFLKKGHKVTPVSDFRHLVYSSAERFGKQNAFVLRGRNITYYEFCLEYKYLTTYFLSEGYKGKRIAVVGANSYGWILGYLAASTVGVSVPIDKELSSEDILNFINEAECSAVIGDSAILKELETNIPKFAISKNNIVKKHTQLSTNTIDRYLSFSC